MRRHAGVAKTKASLHGGGASTKIAISGSRCPMPRLLLCGSVICNYYDVSLAFRPVMACTTAVSVKMPRAGFGNGSPWIRYFQVRPTFIYEFQLFARIVKWNARERDPARRRCSCPLRNFSGRSILSSPNCSGATGYRILFPISRLSGQKFEFLFGHANNARFVSHESRSDASSEDNSCIIS